MCFHNRGAHLGGLFSKWLSQKERITNSNSSKRAVALYIGSVSLRIRYQVDEKNTVVWQWPMSWKHASLSHRPSTLWHYSNAVSKPKPSFQSPLSRRLATNNRQLPRHIMGGLPRPTTLLLPNIPFVWLPCENGHQYYKEAIYNRRGSSSYFLSCEVL